MRIEEEVEEELWLLKTIKMDKSPSSDVIYPREARDEIAGTLARIFISSLTTGKVLED